MSLDIKYLDENDQPIIEPMLVSGGREDGDGINHITGGETPEYEISAGGLKETWDPAKPDASPVVDPMSLAKMRLSQLQAVNRILRRDKRAIKLEERHVKKVAKGRRKNKLAKASRKKNRK